MGLPIRCFDHRSSIVDSTSALVERLTQFISTNTNSLTPQTRHSHPIRQKDTRNSQHLPAETKHQQHCDEKSGDEYNV